MSSSKVTTVLRPTSQLPNAAAAPSAVQHIIHQPIQVRVGCGESARKCECLLGVSPSARHSERPWTASDFQSTWEDVGKVELYTVSDPL